MGLFTFEASNLAKYLPSEPSRHYQDEKAKMDHDPWYWPDLQWGGLISEATAPEEVISELMTVFEGIEAISPEIEERKAENVPSQRKEKKMPQTDGVNTEAHGPSNLDEGDAPFPHLTGTKPRVRWKMSNGQLKFNSAIRCQDSELFNSQIKPKG